MVDGTPFSPEQVEASLYDAGRTLLALRVSGCWPAGYRSNMPETLRDPEDLKYAEPQYSAPQPNPHQVSAMDRALRWLAQLPNSTPAEIRIKRLVSARMLVSPKNDRPLYSWRKLGDKAGISHVWAKTLWVQAVADLTAIANRRLPAPCAGTFARIRAAGTANKFAPSLARIEAIASRPLPLPCIETVRRIQETEIGAPVPAEMVPA